MSVGVELAFGFPNWYLGKTMTTFPSAVDIQVWEEESQADLPLQLSQITIQTQTTTLWQGLEL